MENVTFIKTLNGTMYFIDSVPIVEVLLNGEVVFQNGVTVNSLSSLTGISTGTPLQKVIDINGNLNISSIDVNGPAGSSKIFSKNGKLVKDFETVVENLDIFNGNYNITKKFITYCGESTFVKCADIKLNDPLKFFIKIPNKPANGVVKFSFGHFVDVSDTSGNVEIDFSIIHDKLGGISSNKKIIKSFSKMKGCGFEFEVELPESTFGDVVMIVLERNNSRGSDGFPENSLCLFSAKMLYKN